MAGNGRMKGRYSDEAKEIAKHLYAAEKNFRAVAKKVGVSEATVRNWAKKWKQDPEFDVLCDKKKASFADKADKIIDSGLELLQRRFDKALKFERELDIILEKLSEEDACEPSEVTEFVKKTNELKLQNIREITTAIGTLYDKRALAKGESTGNTSVKVILPNGSDEYAG